MFQPPKEEKQTTGDDKNITTTTTNNNSDRKDKEETSKELKKKTISETQRHSKYTRGKARSGGASYLSADNLRRQGRILELHCAVSLSHET